MLRTDGRATKEQLVYYKKKYEESEAAYKALEEASQKMEKELRRKSWKRGMAKQNLKEDIKTLKADKKHLTEESADLGSAHEGGSGIIEEQNTKIASLKKLVDCSDKVIDKL